MKFKIEYGIGGGFNDIRKETKDFESQKAADDYAYDMAIEVFQEYEGIGGLRTIEAIMDEDGVDEDEAENTYREERESWLEYGATPIKEKIEKTVDKLSKEIKKEKGK